MKKRVYFTFSEKRIKEKRIKPIYKSFIDYKEEVKVWEN